MRSDFSLYTLFVAAIEISGLGNAAVFSDFFSLTLSLSFSHIVYFSPARTRIRNSTYFPGPANQSAVYSIPGTYLLVLH